MLDIKFIRENPELIRQAATKKKLSFNVDLLLTVDRERLRLLGEIEERRSRQNRMSEEIARATGSTREGFINEMRIVKEGMQKLEEDMKLVMKDWQTMMLAVPNIPDFSVPEGASDADNQELRTWGEKPTFAFDPKSHVDLLTNLGLLDLERGTKVSGFRGYFLKGDLARLEMALWHFVADFFYKKGYEALRVPSLVRREPFMGTGYLPQSEEDLYKTQDETYLSGTAEVATMGYYMNEVIDRAELPKKFISFSPCFRREAGSHGKDTKGMVRVHEFYKFEQVILCEASHQTSVELHETLTANAEELMQALQIPYRVVVNCGGDLGLGQVKKYDIEAWVPSEKTYRETHSSSYFHDFQTRRLNIRYKDAEGRLQFAHSLNNTAMATPRLLVPLIENNQQEDGSIKVPAVLHSYMGKEFFGKV